MTTKSQVTIPKAVRDVFKLQKGDLVLFVGSKRQVLLRKATLKIEV